MKDQILYLLDMTDKVSVFQVLDKFLHPKAEKSMVVFDHETNSTSFIHGLENLEVGQTIIVIIDRKELVRLLENGATKDELIDVLTSLLKNGLLNSLNIFE
jgi:hypothetical protein